MAKLTDAQTAFLRESPFLGIVTTLRADGSPHTTTVWVDVDDAGTVGFNTFRGGVKATNLERDPRLSLMVVNPENPWHWVSLSGKGELTDEGADTQIDKLSKKYLGKDEYPWRRPGQQRVSVWITPEKVSSIGFDGG